MFFAHGFGCDQNMWRLLVPAYDKRYRIVLFDLVDPIPGALQTSLFEPMTRGRQAGENKARSVGLGLYIVREIARAHGGEATVISTANDGTTFQISWPG